MLNNPIKSRTIIRTPPDSRARTKIRITFVADINFRKLGLNLFKNQSSKLNNKTKSVESTDKKIEFITIVLGQESHEPNPNPPPAPGIMAKATLLISNVVMADSITIIPVGDIFIEFTKDF